MAPDGRGGAAVRWDSTVLPPLAAAARKGRTRRAQALEAVVLSGRAGGIQARCWVFWLPGSLLAGLPEDGLSGVVGVRSRSQRRDRPGISPEFPSIATVFNCWWSTAGRMLADPERQRWDLAQHASVRPDETTICSATPQSGLSTKQRRVTSRRVGENRVTM